MGENEVLVNNKEDLNNENLDETLEKEENNVIKEDISGPISIPTFEEAENLVKERINGFRKGAKDVPNYLHSFRVRDLLKENRFDETVQMAGLLHDIVEDGDTSFDELKQLGYSDEVIRLVDLATHNMKTKDKFQRWKDMMKRLEEACDRNARAIKLADICDNVNCCHTMSNLEKKKRFLFEKCPYFVDQGNKWFGGSEFYLEFLRRYHKQLKRFAESEKKLAAGKVLWILTWIAFIGSVSIGGFGWYLSDSSLMKLGLEITICLGIFMGILHVICFRIPHKVDE